jgi:GntR family transcriptional regulator
VKSRVAITRARPAIGQTASEVRRALLERIASDGLHTGERLGDERSLATELGVSRATLRRALDALESEGVLRRVPGRGGGTFVSRLKVERDLSSILGVPAYLRRQGISAGSIVLSASIDPADGESARELHLSADALVVSVVRIRLADASPISLEHARFPADRVPGMLQLPLGGSLYEVLQDRYGVVPAEAVERIEVAPASDGEAALLEVEPRAPLLSIRRTTTDADGQPIEFSIDLFRGDRTRIVVRTEGRGAITRSARVGGELVGLGG